MASSYDDLPATPPPATGSDGADANKDPLTQEPGAHPVGVGVGAASAGAVGALIGSVAGPIGVLVGSVIGAVAGAVVGKETAESVNPTDPTALAEANADTGDDTVAEMPAAEVLPVTSFPEPMAEPSPSPGSRLHRIVLAEHPAPPLEITTQTAYPEGNVREAAYFRYLERERTGRGGSELDDWTDAEREVLRG